MTPKEKADELCRKMLYQIEWNAQPSTVKGVAKQCALVAVDYIINVTCTHCDFPEYWQEVKEEIEKL